jgi:hypothetical protein
MALSQQNIGVQHPFARQKTQKFQRRRRHGNKWAPHFLTLPSQRRLFGAKKGAVRAFCTFSLSLSVARTESVLLRQSRAGKNEGRQPAAAAGLNLLFWLQSFVFYYVSASCVCVCCGSGSGTPGVCVCMNYFFAHADYTSARAAAAGLRRVSLLCCWPGWVGGVGVGGSESTRPAITIFKLA